MIALNHLNQKLLNQGVGEGQKSRLPVTLGYTKRNQGRFPVTSVTQKRNKGQFLVTDFD